MEYKVGSIHFFLNADYLSGKIVELKSGKPFRENEYGLSRNHYMQTLLYDLAIRSAFGDAFQATNYILYCKLSQERLRRAPTIKHVQFEALKMRNDLVAISHHLLHPVEGDSLLFRFDHSIFAHAGGFIYRDAQKISGITKSLSSLEQAHLRQFISLVVSENYVAKVGGGWGHRRMGFSALWQSDPEQKEKEFSIYRKLEILERLDDSVYRFKINKDNKLANFRIGDIVVLYPHSRELQPINGQLLRGSIIFIESHTIDIRLRNPLIRTEVFESIEHWNAEHDFLESSSRNAMRSLFGFYHLRPERRAVYLGLQRPTFRADGHYDMSAFDLTNRQSDLLQEMLCAEDYYLLWGPPGTGKTSVMLAALVRYIMNYTEESMLLVAYTNRAVDEICRVLNQYFPDDYIRIGSSYSIPNAMKPKLLQSKLKHLNKRSEVNELISSCRIFTGTVASICGKDELFHVKKFNRMVVDEASQILEPQLLGLMAKVEKTILIGDHKQLPAVVVTETKHTKIDHPELRAAGFVDCAQSLFERLMRTCERNNWQECIGRLDRQGRMHQDINNFVSKAFYNGYLNIIDHVPEIAKRLSRPLESFYIKGFPKYADWVFDRRVMCIHGADDGADQFGMQKMSEAEADLTTQICLSILSGLKDGDSVGIICPFRAQIALVRKKMEQQVSAWPENLSIDTVERYQGGARDVIIISTCSVNERTFRSIQSRDVDGVDRKLNVALSRGREQIIIIGNMDVLSTDMTYKELIHYANHLT